MSTQILVDSDKLRQVFDALRQCEFTTPPAQRKIVTAAKDALRAALEQPAPVQEPAAKAMTAHRAAYFMERFKKEEKLLGPNEQAAVDFVIDMLAAAQTPQPAPVQEPRADELMRLWAPIAEVLLKDPHNDKMRMAFRKALDDALEQPAPVQEPVTYWDLSEDAPPVRPSKYDPEQHPNHVPLYAASQAQPAPAERTVQEPCAGLAAQLEAGKAVWRQDQQRIAALLPVLWALEAALEWIDAVPSDTVLPTMPGFDRDFVDTLIAKAKAQ